MIRLPPARLRASTLCQIEMHRGDRHRAFADRGSAALDRAMPHVAGGKDTRHVRLHRIGVAIERPVLGPLAVDLQIGAGHKIAGRVAQDADVGGPARLRHATEAEKEPAGLRHPFISGPVIPRSCGRNRVSRK